MFKELKNSIKAIAVFTIIIGIIYPLAITGIAKMFFKENADGSIIKNSSGKAVGSNIIGQSFEQPYYFHPRPSYAGNGYDASSSSASNLGPTNRRLIDNIKNNIYKTKDLNPQVSDNAIPIDAVTSSASGLDPHISPKYAELQIPRVAKERRMAENEVKTIVDKSTESRQFGFLGEPRVNVLILNINLDEAAKNKRNNQE